MSASNRPQSVTRQRSSLDWLALAVLAGLLLLNFIQIGLAVATRTYVIVEMRFTVPEDGRSAEVGYMLREVFRGRSAPAGVWDPLLQEAIRNTIRSAGPNSRLPRPEVGISGHTLSVTLVARDAVSANTVYDRTTDDLRRLLQERYKSQLKEAISPAGIAVTPYPWVKPFEYLATLILLGSLLAWQFAR